jgi:hypothetical protein
MKISNMDDLTTFGVGEEVISCKVASVLAAYIPWQNRRSQLLKRSYRRVAAIGTGSN